MKNEVEYCRETKKFSYSSEAKATRAMNRYTDIKRVYRCDSCSKWHTTSISREEAIEIGIDVYTPQEITSEDIKNRLKELQKH